MRYLPIFILLALAGCNQPAGEEVEVAETVKMTASNSSNTDTMEQEGKGKITGIGGVFFKCKDPARMKEWYSEHFGMNTDQYGTMFQSRNMERPEEINYLQWSPFDNQTKYFEPSQKEFMINYRVENIENLVEYLKSSGVEVVDTIATYDYGKFVHVMDPEGNKIELWEPVDQTFTEGEDAKTN